MFTYVIPVKCNVQITNGRKSPAKGFVLVILKKNIIIPLWPPYYMSQKLQTTISKTEIKHYNQFRSVRTEYLRWLKMTSNTVMKLKVETRVKERY